MFGEGKVEHDVKLFNSSSAVRKDINILVYESDPDIQNLYQQYMEIISPHLSCTIVDNIEQLTNGCDNSIIDESTFAQRVNFDAIILDIRVGNHDILKIVKKLHQNLPRQKIVLTTTADPRLIKEEAIRQGLSSRIDILQKPFSFSTLLAVIAPYKE